MTELLKQKSLKFGSFTFTRRQQQSLKMNKSSFFYVPIVLEHRIDTIIFLQLNLQHTLFRFVKFLNLMIMV